VAFITYKLSRPKNAYEKSLDYNERVTWWVSFITNWFWITDVTELSSNQRECERGFNSYIMSLSAIFIACLAAQHYFLMEYATYISILAYFIMFLMIVYPLFKLMARTSLYFFIYYVIFLNLFSFEFGGDYIASAALCFIYYIGLNIPGVFYNKKYLDRISTRENFTVDEIEINKLSLFWVYNKLINKQSAQQFVEKEKQRLIIKKG
jgi:hypothetical protein